MFVPIRQQTLIDFGKLAQLPSKKVELTRGKAISLVWQLALKSKEINQRAYD
jgi:hypothetical protein